jgi:8-hydroxy-5-deazaflavin:NADPH oxidoreductase
MKRIAIVGGTGDLGLGLAARLAASQSVTVGSRDAARAAEAAAKVSSLSGRKVEGATNIAAVEGSDLAILAIPDLPSDDALLLLKPGLAGKLVISPIVPMVFKDGLFAPVTGRASAAEKVASVLQTRVAAAFHSVPAARLLEVGAPLNYDVLVAAESREVFAETAEVVSSILGLRPLFCGPLSSSRTLESLTPTLLNTGKLNKLRTPSIKIV